MYFRISSPAGFDFHNPTMKMWSAIFWKTYIHILLRFAIFSYFSAFCKNQVKDQQKLISFARGSQDYLAFWPNLKRPGPQFD
jgi:hypothetical protein